jgi:WhiB family redox-sensing transcriptional regulator
MSRSTGSHIPKGGRVRDTDWMRRAACRGMDTSAIFFDGPDTPPRAKKNDTTRRVCIACPVKVECLEFAIENNESGVWNHTNEVDRRNLRSQKRAKAS